MRTPKLLALAAFVAGCLAAPLAAADTEKKDSYEHYVSVGEVEVVLKSASSTGITIHTAGQAALPANVARLIGAPAKGKPGTDVTIDFTSECKIRLLHLPPVFDKDGKKTVRTSDELNKLKGNSSLPGYEADATDLKANQLVKVTLVKAKNAIAGETTKFYAKRILIEKDAPAAAKTPDKKPDDKKK
jgi:hypothetical protein